ncbi:Glycosyl transferase containing protein [Klebsormidium nitens]|uniref:Glycosyl transferase containing protein n=1 Tax=Klebsormidium nitens TaxID=105231 RepID=A0A1Y1IN94_KLENI|nr:Glycosyl transferase containing protein [Klebsormidium nitens]|eukprot:GAQ90641.1 Glycosyl transferase containing protein [Klebsormidium nitens]
MAHHQVLVSSGQPSGQPAAIDTNKDVGAQDSEKEDFRVTAVEPAYGLRSGGYAVLIRGRYFGPMGSSLLATIGDVPCNETRWLSSEALHCLVPSGRGVNLPVKVHLCLCQNVDPSKNVEGSGRGLPTSRVGETVSGTQVTFSYEEDAVIAATKHLDMGWTDSPILLHRGLLKEELSKASKLLSAKENQLPDGSEEESTRVFLEQPQRIPYEFRNKSSGLIDTFMVAPAMLKLLPSVDSQARYASCAVMGHSGALIGSRLGPLIDGHEAVFRFDNAPTIPRYGPDVGERTTYQVLDHRWARVLIGASSDRPDHIREVARWWSDTASVVLWAPVKFLSPEFVSTVQATTLRLRRVLESILLPGAPPEDERAQDAAARALEWSANAAPTSLFKTVALATRACDQVTLYGVYGPCIATKKTCHWRYFDEREPTEPERRRTEWEETILLALERAGYLNITAFGKTEGRKAGYVEGARVGLSPQTETEREKETELRSNMNRTDEQSRRQNTSAALAECRQKACLPSCGSHGTFRDGKCVCDSMYSGTDCAESVLLSKGRNILDGLDLRYKGPMRMNREEVEETRDGKLVIKVPEGTAGNHTFDGDQYQVGRRLFSLLPATDHRPRFGSCAIVGNSGSMLVTRRGRAIDAHDMVWRFNQAPVQGFTPYVGSKTDFEMLNSAWVKQLLEGDDAAVAQFAHIGWWRGLPSPGEENGPPGWIWREPNSTIVLYEMFDPAQFPFRDAFQIDFKQKWWRANYAKMRALYPRRAIISLSPQYATWAHNVYKALRARFEGAGFGVFGGEKPMSGFYAILYCLQVCNSIDVYGFTPYRDEDVLDPLALQYHYFDLARPRVGSHSFDMTRYFYELLAAKLGDHFRIVD